MNENSKSQKLLDKVYKHLESIDVTKLSMDELKDFLEVVQKGQFLESYGHLSSTPFGYGYGAPVNPCGSCGAESDDSRESSNKVGE